MNNIILKYCPMKKLVLVLVLSVVLAPCVSAGTPPSWAKRSVALEAGLGVVWAPNLMFFDHSLPGISGYLELDHYLSSLPMSVGVVFQATDFTRKSNQPLFEYGNSLSFPSLRLMLVADYYKVLGNNISLYGGVGAGLAYFDNSGELTYIGNGWLSDSGIEFGLSARVRAGVLLHKRYRLDLSYTHGDSANSYLGLSVGFVF